MIINQLLYIPIMSHTSVDMSLCPFTADILVAVDMSHNNFDFLQHSLKKNFVLME